ncbi:Ser/Thr protein kinase RdoA involved in Cpx stress response, MazF antagonist [Lachnospiraceae bacterium NE2001]|nr:Ser/Thr protein kinase RdoA involved in Cpx stress response, MazF antagonist [Lachnospiraceae bacterium NE2001]
MNPGKICENFIVDRSIDVSILREGHINDTYIVRTSSHEFILQRIQKEMNISHLEHNYSLYSEALDRDNLLYPKWMKTLDGSRYYIDEKQDAWRMYPYIECERTHSPLSKELLYTFGEGLARLHNALQMIEGDVEPLYPHLHDLKLYYQKYTQIIASDDNINTFREPQVESRIKTLSEIYISPEEEPKAIIHADTKLSNILFKDGQVIGFLDFDTVMPGPVTLDIADAIRSCCIQNGKIDKEAANYLVEGYISISDERRVEEVKNNLWHDFNKLCFELSLRYYIDAVSGENHFKDKEPAYKLERAKSLLEIII